jgi:voltage-gated sodium channel
MGERAAMSTLGGESAADAKANPLGFVDAMWFQLFTAAVILANAAYVTFDSYGVLPEAAQSLDQLFVLYFCLEMALKIAAHRGKFFKNPWNIFDLVVILPSLIPALGVLSVARIFRVIRLLRLVSMFRSFRDLTTAMLRSVADAVGMCGIIICINFVFSAIAHAAFKEIDPEHFGDIGVAMLSLFRSFTFMEATNIVDSLTEGKLFGGVLFFSYYFIMTYLILSFFVAIATYYMYNVMDERYAEEEDTEDMDSLKAEIAEMKEMLKELAAQQRN